jgi:alkylation response protein AidB-like acyl-CoA dehydrogenase
MANPLLRDRDVEFLLYEVLRVDELCALPAFAEHSRETFDLVLASARKLAREVLFPAFKPMDEEQPSLANGQVHVHPIMREIWPRMVELGLAAAARPADVGGQSLPLTVISMAHAYLMAGNAAAFGYMGLTAGAAHLLEAFAEPGLRETYMPRMYGGEWSGTMALTEPHAGSSLSDVKTRAVPTADGYYLMTGNKVFISGGDQDVTDNIVHLALGRIEGAPPGIKGVSLFCIPKKRFENGVLVDNDCTSAGVFHKMGWRGLPSIALNFGERGDCRGYLVGKANQGIGYMFQMMNEARIMVGMNGVATAAAAFHESLEYARTRPQGRALSSRDPATPQLPIIEHADVRRMLLRQKAIVEGGLALLVTTARFADLAAHATDEALRKRAALLVDLLTPVAKSFPAEKGFESNALAVQVHGGYGYTSEYLPETWLRDQKLNSLHEGTTGIQGLDLLGRKVAVEGGAALAALGEELRYALTRAAQAGLPQAWQQQLAAAGQQFGELTLHLAQKGLRGDHEGMLLHSADFLEIFSTLVIAWQWLAQASAAQEGLATRTDAQSIALYQGKLCAAQYWFSTELPRIEHLSRLCASGEDSYARVQPDWL